MREQPEDLQLALAEPVGLRGPGRRLVPRGRSEHGGRRLAPVRLQQLDHRSALVEVETAVPGRHPAVERLPQRRDRRVTVALRVVGEGTYDVRVDHAPSAPGGPGLRRDPLRHGDDVVETIGLRHQQPGEGQPVDLPEVGPVVELDAVLGRPLAGVVEPALG